MLWLLCDLRYKSNYEAVFWIIVKNTQLRACGTHPFQGPTSNILFKKGPTLALEEWKLRLASAKVEVEVQAELGNINKDFLQVFII